MSHWNVVIKGKNCHIQQTNFQFSRDGGSQFWINAMSGVAEQGLYLRLGFLL
jgi:hypothetical protein